MLMRRPTPFPETPPASEIPSSPEAVDAALAALEHDRQAILAALASIPEREQTLLDADADDEAFIALEIEKKRAERALERLDRREQQLVQLAEQFENDSRQSAYGSIRERYILASHALADAAARVSQLIETVNEISRECDRCGFSQMMIPTLPPPGYSAAGAYMTFGGHLGVLRNHASVAERTPAQVPISSQPRTQAVRFLRFTEFRRAGYQRGQIASFLLSDARRLVDAGYAEFMQRGMAFDPIAASWGAGPAPAESKPDPEET